MTWDLRALAETIKMELRANTVVLFFVPRNDTKKIAETLKMMRVWQSYNITPIAVPDDIYVQVIPPGSELVLNERETARPSES